jgi:CO/xanthine dehydrogenase Mo-binding subunit
VLTNPWGLDAHRGDVAAGLASADVTIEATYTTPDLTNNPLGLFATVAAWDGDSLNADVPELEVIFVGEPDRFNPIGVKGVGEVGLVGMAAAIANAVFHATGLRIRALPITIDRLL